METTVLLSKTGKMNMGGYFKEKTAQLTEIDGFKYCYRVCYVGDSFDECFTSLDEAKARFAQLSESIIPMKAMSTQSLTVSLIHFKP
jgi:hypothetical protein